VPAIRWQDLDAYGVFRPGAAILAFTFMLDFSRTVLAKPVRTALAVFARRHVALAFEGEFTGEVLLDMAG